MKLNYFELLSPEPVYIQNAGGILSPKLKDIARIGINTYQYYLAVLLMDLKTYFTVNGQEKHFEALSEEEKNRINIFDLLTMDNASTALLQNALNFFIEEDIVYSAAHNGFLINKNIPDEKINQTADKYTFTGIITKESYPLICDLISQRNYIKSDRPEDLSKVKSKKASEIMKKLQKGREKKSNRSKADKNLELGNIISAVANKSQSLNIINIWELTIYQLWDCFSRLSNNSIYDIEAMSVAAWGNKDNYFDAAAWFKGLDTV